MTVAILSKRPTYPFGRPPEGMDVLWRCEAKRYAYCVNEDQEEYATTAPRLELTWYLVERRTPKGAYLSGLTGHVRLTAKRKFACETEAEAIASFARRREVQISILRRQLARAESEAALVCALETSV